ncbi:MAG: hypothetical protein COB53_01775 [Elusimicrobia bacterium]|nr:MAG: hypothetical protein COB53_01775 [Elusimicrobiota bacterium]
MSGEAKYEFDDSWDNASREPLEIFAHIRMFPMLLVPLLFGTLCIFWFSHSAGMGAFRAGIAALVFLVVWTLTTAFLPTIFKGLFVILIIGVAGWAYIMIRAKMPDMLQAGLMTFIAVALATFIGVTILRAEFLVPVASDPKHLDVAVRLESIKQRLPHAAPSPNSGGTRKGRRTWIGEGSRGPLRVGSRVCGSPRV